MQQKQKPITFITAAKTLGTLMTSSIETLLEGCIIDIETLNFTFMLTPIASIIYNSLLDEAYYHREEIIAEVKAVNIQAQQYFKVNNWFQATEFFCISLLFGEKKDRHGILYNLASCYRHRGETDIAILFLNICKEHAPGSSIGIYATNWLNKLRPAESEPNEHQELNLSMTK